MTNETNITFRYAAYSEGETTRVNKDFSGYRAEYLPKIIEEFVGFLIHMGFTYVDGEVLEVPGGFLILKDKADLNKIGEFLAPRQLDRDI